MFVVYEVEFRKQKPWEVDKNLKSNWRRLSEFKTLEEANYYLQERMNKARDKGLDVSYTIVMES